MEIVFVNDGSTDASGVVIDDLARTDNHVTVVHLSRNFGHQAALRIGLEYVQGDYIAIMDDDLQDHPRFLKNFFVAEQGRGIMGVIDGFAPKGVEAESDISARKDFLRKIGYKL